MTDERTVHWDTVYRTKPADTVSWYQPAPGPSLDALARAGIGPRHSLIDIGAGASSLADALLDRGWSDLAALDVASEGLEVARRRLAQQADRVTWIVADIVSWTPPRRWDVWHDRAVFHFLTDPSDRAGYLRALDLGLAPGGLLIIATFAADGPERCSGLPVQRYSAEALAETLGPGFTLAQSWREEHQTPAGGAQRFTWCVFERR